VQNEAYIDREMYFYRADPFDSVQHGIQAGTPLPRPAVSSPAFRWLDWPPVPKVAAEANAAAAEEPA
jgi:hypothetical protein